MLDAALRHVIDPPLNAIARLMVACRINANWITVLGFLFGIGGCVAIAFQEYLWGLGLIILNRLADGLDGPIARRTGATDLGGFLDIILDTIFYSGVPFAFALADPTRAIASAFLIYSFVGTGGTFMAYAIIAGKRGITTEVHGKKSFFYSVGLMEGTETIIFFVLFCLFPNHYVNLAWMFGGLCWLTTLIRIAQATIVFRQKPPREQS